MNQPTIGFHPHDHSACVSSGLLIADKICQDQNLRLTPIRRRVLEILLTEHRAYGAYEILEKLRLDGQSAQPPIAYRALEFLTTHGLAHKVESLNAYIACIDPEQDHAPAFMICTDCSTVAEAITSPLSGRLGDAARDVGFAINHTVIEAEGLCSECQEK